MSARLEFVELLYDIMRGLWSTNIFVQEELVKLSCPSCRAPSLPLLRHAARFDAFLTCRDGVLRIGRPARANAHDNDHTQLVCQGALPYVFANVGSKTFHAELSSIHSEICGDLRGDANRASKKVIC